MCQTNISQFDEEAVLTAQLNNMYLCIMVNGFEHTYCEELSGKRKITVPSLTVLINVIDNLRQKIDLISVTKNTDKHALLDSLCYDV